MFERDALKIAHLSSLSDIYAYEWAISNKSVAVQWVKNYNPTEVVFSIQAIHPKPVVDDPINPRARVVYFSYFFLFFLLHWVWFRIIIHLNISPSPQPIPSHLKSLPSVTLSLELRSGLIIVWVFVNVNKNQELEQGVKPWPFTGPGHERLWNWNRNTWKPPAPA